MFWNLGIVSTLMRLLLLDCFGGNNEEVDFEGFAWNSTNVLVLSNFKSAHLEVKAQVFWKICLIMWKCLGWRPWDIYKTKLFILVAFQFVFIAIYWFDGVVVAYEWQTTLDVARGHGRFQVTPSTIFNTDLGGNIIFCWIKISSCWLI